jgi:hypothetical protein
MRDFHCESVCHAGRVAEEEEENGAKGIAHASADDFARKPGQFTGGDGDSERPRGREGRMHNMNMWKQRRSVQFKKVG